MDPSGSAIYGELEIGLSGKASGGYQVELRLTDPDTDTDVAPVRGDTAIDTDSLIGLLNFPDQLGQALTNGLFHDPEIRSFYARAAAIFERSGRVLRLRLTIGPGASDLNSLFWELLRDPITGAPLATSERVLFSRFMLSADWRPARLAPKDKLRALIAVSAPGDIASKYRLAPVDLSGEISRARASLGAIEASVLGRDQPLTLPNLIDALRLGVDVLYLVCHGSFPKGLEPVLFLQNDNGDTARIEARDLALRIAELSRLPRLVVLASCESAGRDSISPTTGSLASQLADAGVPAVLAMQGNISMETVRLMMPIFFRELMVDGQIDRAVGVARGAVRDRTDFWMPALYLRLRGGRIWYVPGFAGGASQFEQWKAICRFIRSGQCVPLVGPDLEEHIYGSTRAMAAELATANGFPLSETDRSDLAKVAQYVATRSQLKDVWRQIRTLQLRNLLKFAAERGILIDQNTSPAQVFDSIASCLMEDPNEPLCLLAGIAAKVFVTACSDPLFELLLHKAGKTPSETMVNWRDERRDDSGTKFEGEPTSAHPLLYYVYGRSKYEETWVVTEDDFFDFLIRMSAYDLMPMAVSRAVTGGSLLFLGFPLHDWKFRVLLRMIRSKGGSSNLELFSHVGVQIDPEDHTFSDAVRARKYLETYFSKANINIFWGSSGDFLKELGRQMESTKDSEPHLAMADAAAW